jgi:hypothetical protein
MASTIKKVAIVLVGLVIIVAIAIPTILHKAGVHPEYNGTTTELPGLTPPEKPPVMPQACSDRN